MEIRKIIIKDGGLNEELLAISCILVFRKNILSYLDCNELHCYKLEEICANSH